MNIKRLLITVSLMMGITIVFGLLLFANQASAQAHNGGPSREDVLPPGQHNDTNKAIQAASIWNILTIPYEGEFHHVSSLVLDSSGNPHISFSANCYSDEDIWTCSLMYAFRDDAGWHFQTVGDDQGTESSLVLDGSGYPHLSYCGEWGECFNLHYAHQDDTGWHIQDIDFMGPGNSLALDSSGYPHISYIGFSHPNYELKYIYQDADGWHYQNIDSVTNDDWHTSLVLDSDGYPHISYIQAGNLMYACLDESGWHIQSVDTAGYSSSASLALDAEDHPHISYSRGYVPSLRYAYHDDSGWHFQSIDSEEVRWSSFALGADDRPHISYLDNANEVLKYAYQDITGWSTETVDSADVGWWARSVPIDVDGNGLPHISYKAGAEWKYAYKVPITPTAVTLSGPTAGILDRVYTFTAVVSPISASLPIQYQWQATDQTPMTHTGNLSDSVVFAWELPGAKSITITASNPAGTVSDTHLITLTEVTSPYKIFMPLIVKSPLFVRAVAKPDSSLMVWCRLSRPDDFTTPGVHRISVGHETSDSCRVS